MTEKMIETWLVKNVPESTRKKIKMYALKHDMEIAEAITDIVKNIKI